MPEHRQKNLDQDKEALFSQPCESEGCHYLPRAQETSIIVIYIRRAGLPMSSRCVCMMEIILQFMAVILIRSFSLSSYSPRFNNSCRFRGKRVGYADTLQTLLSARGGQAQGSLALCSVLLSEANFRLL